MEYMMMIPPSKSGMAKNISANLESTVSTHPPKYAAIVPRIEPRMAVNPAVNTPTIIEALAPWIVRAKMSQPWKSYPKIAARLGG